MNYQWWERSLTFCEADKLKEVLQQSEKRQKQLRACHQDRWLLCETRTIAYKRNVEYCRMIIVNYEETNAMRWRKESFCMNRKRVAVKPWLSSKEFIFVCRSRRSWQAKLPRHWTRHYQEMMCPLQLCKEAVSKGNMSVPCETYIIAYHIMSCHVIICHIFASCLLLCSSSVIHFRLQLAGWRSRIWTSVWNSRHPHHVLWNGVSCVVLPGNT